MTLINKSKHGIFFHSELFNTRNGHAKSYITKLTSESQPAEIFDLNMFDNEIKAKVAKGAFEEVSALGNMCTIRLRQVF